MYINVIFLLWIKSILSINKLKIYMSLTPNHLQETKRGGFFLVEESATPSSQKNKPRNVKLSFKCNSQFIPHLYKFFRMRSSYQLLVKNAIKRNTFQLRKRPSFHVFRIGQVC